MTANETTTKTMNASELKTSNEYVLHHTSLCRGYVSRKTEGIVRAYKGRFGEGYTLEHPNWESNSYSFVSYYVKKDA